MLAALLVIVLAATFALVVVAAVHSMQLTEGADAAGWRARALADEALADVVRTWRWSPALAPGHSSGSDAGSSGSWRATWEPLAVAGCWPRMSLRVEGAWSRACWDEELAVELRAQPWAQGVTCAGDAEIADELEVAGSGVYVGGCLRGRENVRFVAADGGVTAAGDPADAVHGDVFPAAAVHGGAGVYARGVEIHEGAGDSFPADTDCHVSVPAPSAWLESPGAEFLLASDDAATPAGDWLNDGCLRLDRVSPAAGADAAGRCLVLPAVDEVTVLGSLPAEAGCLLVVVRGDATVGRPGETVALRGGLVVRGRLTVRGALTLTGPLHAGSVVVEAPARVYVPAGWRAQPLAGAVVPTVVERGG